jgi:hypothetical protein
VEVFGVFEVGAAIGADVAKFAVFALADVVFLDVPVFGKLGVFDNVFEFYLADMPKMMQHAGTVLDVTVLIDAYLAVEAGVVMLRLGEKINMRFKIKPVNITT